MPKVENRRGVRPWLLIQMLLTSSIILAKLSSPDLEPNPITSISPCTSISYAVPVVVSPLHGRRRIALRCQIGRHILQQMFTYSKRWKCSSPAMSLTNAKIIKSANHDHQINCLGDKLEDLSFRPRIHPEDSHNDRHIKASRSKLAVPFLGGALATRICTRWASLGNESSRTFERKQKTDAPTIVRLNSIR